VFVHCYLSGGVVLENLFKVEVSSSLVVLLLLRVSDCSGGSLFYFLAVCILSLDNMLLQLDVIDIVLILIYLLYRKKNERLVLSEASLSKKCLKLRAFPDFICRSCRIVTEST
jgi:hypothetical protein